MKSHRRLLICASLCGVFTLASCHKATDQTNAAAPGGGDVPRPENKVQDKAKLAAAEYFENLTEAAASATESKLDALISSATAAEKAVHLTPTAKATTHVTAQLNALANARTAMNRTDVAIASVEIYRALVSDLSREGVVPTAVNLLDYCGFRYTADLAATPVRWSDMNATMAFAKDQWKPLALNPKIGTALRARFDSAIFDMATAAKKQDAPLATKAAKTELDLVDELELRFPAPTSPAKG